MEEGKEAENAVQPEDCSKCGVAIDVEEFDQTAIKFEQTIFHNECFKCSDCDKRLSIENAISSKQDDKLIIKCQECVAGQEEKPANCKSCKKTFKASSKIIHAFDRQFHKRCFKCYECEKKLKDNDRAFYQGKLYHEECKFNVQLEEDDNVIKVCDKCEEPVDEKFKTYDLPSGETVVIHPNHFNCSSCSKALDMDSHLNEQVKMCNACHKAKGFKKCEACSHFIYGQRVKYKEFYYHTKCFTCTLCQKGLIQESRVTLKDKKICCIQCFEHEAETKCSYCFGGYGKRKIGLGGKYWCKKHMLCYICCATIRPKIDKILLIDLNLICGHCFKQIGGTKEKIQDEIAQINQVTKSIKK